MSPRLKLAAVCCAALLAACGGGGGGAQEAADTVDTPTAPTSVVPPAPAPTPTPTPNPTPMPQPPESPASSPAPTKPPVAETDKYVGTWSGCFAFNTFQSDYETHTFTKISDTVLNSTYSATRHAGTKCEGVGVPEPSAQDLLISMDEGWVIVDDLRANHVIFEFQRSNSFGGKQVMALDAAGRLRFGESSSLRDSGGYPFFFRNVVLQKQ